MLTSPSSRDRAERFATAHGIPTTHVGYRQLVEDPQIDAVYVATPHSEHREHALLAIRAGKHVLVEKSFTRNVAEAQEVFAAAREAGVFVMEAMWTRFLPHVAALHQVIDAGEIGEIVNLRADHGQWFAFDPKHRLFAPGLAGGAPRKNRMRARPNAQRRCARRCAHGGGARALPRGFCTASRIARTIDAEAGSGHDAPRRTS